MSRATSIRWGFGLLLASLLVAVLSGFTMSDSTPSLHPSPDTARAPQGFDLQGHRGARGLAPENTLPAFRRALEIGVTTLELDVVLAADGTVVVSHEPWMARDKCRTPDGNRIPRGEAKTHRIYEMDYETVAAYDCGSLTLSDFPEQVATPARKPRLRDVIEMAEAYTDEHDRAPVFYNVETKSRPEWDGTYHPDPDTFARQVLAVIESAGVGPRTIIQSFDPRTLEATHRHDAAVRTALLVGWAGDSGLSANLAGLSFRPDVYSPTARLVDEALVEAVRKRNLSLIPWTVNEPDEMRRLLRLGVDGFITDYPDRAQAILRRESDD